MSFDPTPDCDIARAFKLIGDHWVLMIIRDLFLQGGCRFSDFQKSVEGINPTTLSTRLKTLEEAGLISRVIYSERPPRAEYHLTDAGRDLKPVLMAVVDWARVHAQTDPDALLEAGRSAASERRKR